MAPIVNSVEIARSPADVFAYVTDVSRQSEWQVGLSRAKVEGDGPVGVGTRITHTRRMGPRDRTITVEVTEHDPPRSFAVRGIDGPIRPAVDFTVDSLDDGARSRVSVSLDFSSHGFGKLVAPLARRQMRTEMPASHRLLKQLLESGE